jgi:hypothetical protein
MREQSLEGIIKMSLALNVQKTNEDERTRKKRRIIIGTWTQIELADSLSSSSLSIVALAKRIVRKCFVVQAPAVLCVRSMTIDPFQRISVMLRLCFQLQKDQNYITTNPELDNVVSKSVSRSSEHAEICLSSLN